MRTVSLFSAALLALAVLCCSCSKDDTISVDINVINISGEELSVVRDNLQQWEDDHADITVSERIRIEDSDMIYLAPMGSEHLPDVFICDPSTGRALDEAGLVCCLSDYAPDIGPFTYNGEVYAFPVFRETVSVVVYDPDNWEPGSAVGYSAENGISISCDYLSAFLGDPQGQEWIGHMTACDEEASFAGDYLTGRIDMIRTRLEDDIPYASVNELTEAFRDGRCPAVLLRGNDIYVLLEQVRQSDPALYGRIGFACLEGDYLPAGFSYGVFVNAGLEGEKREYCIDLARCIAEEVPLAYDDTTLRLEALREESVPVRIITHCFDHGFWNCAREECFSLLPYGDRTSAEYALTLQNRYEEYYFNSNHDGG